jgi:hypothetical protein
LSSIFSGTTDDSDVPAGISVIGKGPSQLINVSTFSYQINNASGDPVTGSAYYAAEKIDAATNTNGQYFAAPNGVITDYVGLNSVVPPEYYGSTAIQTQTYSVLYGGYFYSLPTVLQHSEYVSASGIVTNSVTVISP